MLFDDWDSNWWCQGQCEEFHQDWKIVVLLRLHDCKDTVLSECNCSTCFLAILSENKDSEITAKCRARALCLHFFSQNVLVWSITHEDVYPLGRLKSWHEELFWSLPFEICACFLPPLPWLDPGKMMLTRMKPFTNKLSLMHLRRVQRVSFSAVGVRSEIVPENALSLERSFYLLQRNGNLNMGSLEKVNSKILKKKYKLLQTRVFFVFF